MTDVTLFSCIVRAPDDANADPADPYTWRVMEVVGVTFDLTGELSTISGKYQPDNLYVTRKADSVLFCYYTLASAIKAIGVAQARFTEHIGRLNRIDNQKAAMLELRDNYIRVGANTDRLALKDAVNGVA